MKTKIHVVMALLIFLGGCGTALKEITTKSLSERTDVFSEVKESGAPPAGYADIMVKASLKTHLEGYYSLESGKSLHGKPGYPFLLNIDGQAVVWRVDGEREATPLYDERGSTRNDPEAGDGIKYVLKKTVRLAAGTRVLFLGLPEENYYTKADITLKPGESYVLEFKPHYRYKTLPTRVPTFLKGLDEYEIVLNRKSD